MLPIISPMGETTPVTLSRGDALNFYAKWKQPTVIISDGPYGISGYDGDLNTSEDLTEWYEPHVAAWSRYCSRSTTLWFWNTEVGWAEMHPVLKKHGWIYRACNVWNKGIGHIAGKTNPKTLRRFPIVTEVCAHYVRESQFVKGRSASAQEWLRSEWARTKLPFNRSNEACRVVNVASRKYLTPDYLWYYPPAEMFERLAKYANKFGDAAGRPYFALSGKAVSGSQWEHLRGKFYCPTAITNVWDIPAIKGAERLKIGGKSVHCNQKPLALMDRIIQCSSDKGDTAWEPFGGLCSLASVQLCGTALPEALSLSSEIIVRCRKSHSGTYGSRRRH
jgi:hypothetical protein